MILLCFNFRASALSALTYCEEYLHEKERRPHLRPYVCGNICCCCGVCGCRSVCAVALIHIIDN